MEDDDVQLVQLFIDDIAAGKSYYDIQAKHGIPAEEARALVREYLSDNYVRDRQEWQQLITLRIEKIVGYLWEGVTNGSFKHAEAVVRLIERLTELLALNEQAIIEQDSKISDAQAQTILRMFRVHDRIVMAHIQEALAPYKDAQIAITEYPEWAAEAASEAVEQVIYAELEE